jgi:3-hydroxybutyryl-CoA dehydrogenase
MKGDYQVDKRVGVIGAGVMGQGVALTLTQYGYQVIFVDVTDEILQKAKDEMCTKYNVYRLMNEALSNESFLESITFTTDYSLLKDASIIIENTPELMEVKLEVYNKLEEICCPDCIFLVNTSCLSITEIASFTSREENVMGVHFMNPVPLIHTVEVIKGMKSSEETIESTCTFLKEVGKKSIIINDSVGFVSNRISHLMMNEAMFLVNEGVAKPEQIDQIFKQCYGHKMGPLETADLIGLDTVKNSLNVLYQNYQDSKFRCCPLLKKMVDAGYYGQKSGKGFYDYFY